jgi:hypothetical protein
VLKGGRSPTAACGGELLGPRLAVTAPGAGFGFPLSVTGEPATPRQESADDPDALLVEDRFRVKLEAPTAGARNADRGPSRLLLPQRPRIEYANGVEVYIVNSSPGNPASYLDAPRRTGIILVLPSPARSGERSATNKRSPVCRHHHRELLGRGVVVW